MGHSEAQLLVHDFRPHVDTFLSDVLQGLRHCHKRLPCKYFYDRRGCQLFDQICELEEYYPSRVELQIMRRHAQRMAQCLGPECVLIELGSGSSFKTRILLDHLISRAAYVPVDIAWDHLRATTAQLADDYPALEVVPVCADFTLPFNVPQLDTDSGRRVVYFPGSTIGNFEPGAMAILLERIAVLVGPTGGLLIGIDLVKDAATLHAAYNDQEGVTALFNLNLLQRINRELAADFLLDQFQHRAVYNPGQRRIEMYLTSLARQRVSVGDQQFAIGHGESILTEYSYKYVVQEFQRTARRCGWALEQCWTDARRMFAVLFFEAADVSL